MTNKTLTAFLAAALSVAATSCGGSSAKRSAATADSDSVAEAALETVVIERLPDTIYPSAEKIEFCTDIKAEGVDGRIENLTDLYADAPGAFTFRRGAFRQADFGGRLDSVPSRFEIDWAFETDADNRDTGFGRWGGGSGWTGQPLYVEWPDSCLRRMSAQFAQGFSGREVIVGSLASKVYFIDFATGKASRRAIDVGNPIKGTVSLDPTLNGNLYVGQGVPAQRPFGHLVVDLFKGEVTQTFPEDPSAWRHWGAFDSSPIRVGRFLFRPGENGVVYKYMIEPGRLTLHSTMRYRADYGAPGMEASMAVYANYGFTADNGGNVLGINLDTMRPVWHYSMGDDTDCTPVVEIEDGHPYIYIGSEIDRQGTGGAALVKLDAATGREVWRTKVNGRRFETGKKHFDGGFYASTLPGTADCADLLFANCVMNTDGQNGAFMAFDRKTGRKVYSTPLRIYAWSSPVCFTDPNGKLWVVTGDCAGNLYLIDGRTGDIKTRRNVGNNFESSPVVVGNSLVVGSRGTTIYKISVN